MRKKISEIKMAGARKLLKINRKTSLSALRNVKKYVKGDY